MSSGFARGCICIGGLLLSVAHAADIEAVQKAATDWSKIRAETARLEADWEWQRQLLGSTNIALQDRVQRLERERNELKAKTASGDGEIDELKSQNDALRSALDGADQQLKRVTEQLTLLRPQLPPRLSDALELPYRSLGNAALTPSERMLYATTVLNRVQQFNKTVTYGDELVTVPDGGKDRRLLSVIYWGLGQAYAIDRVSGKAYTGAAAAGGWTWSENPTVKSAMDRIVAIQQEKADPDFIELPVRLAHPAPTR